ncbi:hypothetical protein [Streptomyces montanisoli]|uniref:Uncharacterized protein n=1 Tax=Streptomyces montanisoli TaxID=2798581 RepID=A0A940MAW5_9ACTN|nr:hypothetical protein [Streptomyces montanisoli]MBP0459539.1 hypothetical protein [Streptomyces montanisoli]
MAADSDGALAQMADAIEARQIRSAHVVHGVAVDMLGRSDDLTRGELLFLVRRLRESLTETLAIAASRAQRLGLED